MNRSKLFTVLAAASFLTTAAMAQGGPKPVKTVAPKAAVSMAATDTTKKKPMPKHKKVKKVKPDTTKTKKPN